MTRLHGVTLLVKKSSESVELPEKGAYHFGWYSFTLLKGGVTARIENLTFSRHLELQLAVT